MILLLLGFAGVAALAAAAESLPLDAEPRPLLWLTVVVAFPVAANALTAVVRAGWVRRTRVLLFLGAYAGILYALGWAGWALDELGWRGQPFASLVLLMLPSAALALWASPWFYRSEKNAALAGRGAETARFGRWLTDSARIVSVPFLILLVVSWAAGRIDDWRALDVTRGAPQGFDIAMSGAALLCLLAASPFLVLLAWRTESFPAGALRDRLDEVTARLGVKVRAIRVWDERTRFIVNACAVGVVPGTRAVLFTRGICDLLSDEEISAVFSHEAAHLARGHLLTYAVMGISFLLFLAPLDAALEPAPTWLAWSILAACAALYWIIFLGAVSRRLETEADLTAAQVAGYGAYTSALRKAACLIGPSARRNGWRHFSLERRLALIAEAATDPQIARRVLDSCRRVRVWLWVLLALSAGGFAWSAARESTPEARAAKSVRDAISLIEEAEAMRPIVARAAARRAESTAITRWLGRNPAAMEEEYRRIVEAAKRAVERAERDAPGEAAKLGPRLNAPR